MHSESFVDDIYEAGVMPEKWLGILDRLAAMADGEGTVLFAASPGEPRWLASESIHNVILDWTRSRWFEDNPRGKRLVPLTEPRFLTELDVMAPEEIEASDYYTDMLRPVGLGWCVGTTIRAPSGDTLVFSVEKAHHKGPVPRAVASSLDVLRPHLARAAILSARFGLERAKATVTTLDMIGLPAAALTRTGQVITANGHLLEKAPNVRIGANDKLQFSDARALKLLMEAIAGNAGFEAGFGRSIPVAGTLTQRPFIAHLVPLRGGSLDVFTGAISILYITEVAPNAGLAPELMQALFDLTPAEASVANLIVGNKTIEQIATLTQSSQNTIRSHLKSIFLKTGVHRQTELVNLLGLSIK